MKSPIVQLSVLSFNMVMSEFLAVTLIITLLTITHGGESAYNQCAGLCLYEPNISETKIPPERVDPVNREYTKDYIGSERATGANQAPLISDVLGKSSRHSSDIFPDDRIRVSKALSNT